MQRQGAGRWRDAAIFCAPVAAAIMFIAALNQFWFGSPSVSGYGTIGDLYSFSYVRENLRLYPAWLWQSQGAGVLLAVLALARLRGSNRRSIVLAIAMVLVTFACYVSYAPFDVWWYLRFLLPGFGALSVLDCGRRRHACQVDSLNPGEDSSPRRRFFCSPSSRSRSLPP